MFKADFLPSGALFTKQSDILHKILSSLKSHEIQV